MRFERDAGDGFERLFPETFSFHAERHDPAELFLQLDDLARRPELLSPRANRRDVEQLVARLALGVPRYLEQLLDRLLDRLDADPMARVHEDVAILCQILSRFIGDREGEGPGLRMAGFHLRKLVLRCLLALTEQRVAPDYLERFVSGEVDPVDPADDLSDTGFFYTLEGGDTDAIHRTLVRLTERAFYRWIDDVCLDERNRAFERSGSPFGNREQEVLAALLRPGVDHLTRAGDLSPFLRRPGNRDCMRVVNKLSAWFLRQYDVRHAAAMIRHREDLAAGRATAGRVLSRHRARNYAIILLLLASPHLAAAAAYSRAPRFFDVLCSAELVIVGAVAFWYLAYRFCIKRELWFFHASVPRIAAGIIVGYLPIFFIDEVWGFVNRPFPILALICALLGFVTLLYLYVEVQRRLGDSELAFARTRQLFLLGLLQAFGAGLLITGLTGGYMTSRNWGPAGEVVDVAQLGSMLPPFIGELPRVVGVEPFFTFPGPIFVMAFLSFFIGTFLQLLWEDMPITEPL